MHYENTYNLYCFVLCLHVSVNHIDHHQGILCNIKGTIQNMLAEITSKFCVLRCRKIVSLLIQYKMDKIR
jgi:hypothetical protein